MSSMVRNLRIKALPCATLAALALAAPSSAQREASDPGATLVAQQPGEIAAAIAKWELLQGDRQLGFSDYARFAMDYPDFPLVSGIRTRAEKALGLETPAQADLLRYFDALPPLTNPARGRYALALASAGQPEALDMARAAWRGGEMAEDVELTLESLFARAFTPQDHAVRIDALLWQSEAAAATRQIVRLDPADRPLAMARLALVNGSEPEAAGLTVPDDAVRNAGYVYNLVRYLRTNGQLGNAVAILASRSAFDAPAFDSAAMVGEMLTIAKRASALDAMRIASRTDDLFAPGTDISLGSFALRDRYTDLMWLGGTKALWELGRGADAKGLFERYGKGARTPLTTTKGLFWAGRAAQSAGDMAEATRLYEAATQWPDYYYGQLAYSALRREIPPFAALPRPEITPEQRSEFEARPLSRAILAIAANRRDWRTERRFFQAVGDAVADETEMLMANDLAARAGLPEMSVVLGMKAGERGFAGLERIGFPVIETPVVQDWAIVHAISRQESEFDRTRVSHAGARGIMQLMPGTAREQAGKLGKTYLSADLIERPAYNIELGDAYFRRMLAYYDGAYPLAVGAYNAGPGRVNQWLRLNGDPRRGEIDWVTWVERIPANFETRYYIMRVIGNAVSYSHMYPAEAGLPRPVDAFLP